MCERLLQLTSELGTSVGISLLLASSLAFSWCHIGNCRHLKLERTTIVADCDSG